MAVRNGRFCNRAHIQSTGFQVHMHSPYRWWEESPLTSVNTSCEACYTLHHSYSRSWIRSDAEGFANSRPEDYRFSYGWDEWFWCGQTEKPPWSIAPGECCHHPSFATVSQRTWKTVPRIPTSKEANSSCCYGWASFISSFRTILQRRFWPAQKTSLHENTKASPLHLYDCDLLKVNPCFIRTNFRI